MKNLIYIFITLFFVAACGVKSPPLPPIEKAIPKKTETKKKKKKATADTEEDEKKTSR